MFVGLIAVVVAAVMGWQLRETAALRDAVAREAAAGRTFERASAEHARLVAAQPAVGETDRPADDAAALKQAREEIAVLQSKIATEAHAAAAAQADTAGRFAVGVTVPASEWRNAGTATPQAALETALWAAAGGDVAAFAATMKFQTERARIAAQALLDRLPEGTRAQCDSPERLIAFLTVRDVPLGSAEVRQFSNLDGPTPAAHVRLFFKTADGKPKDSALLLANSGDGWRLLIGEGVVARYAAAFSKSAGGGEAK